MDFLTLMYLAEIVGNLNTIMGIAFAVSMIGIFTAFSIWLGNDFDMDLLKNVPRKRTLMAVYGFFLIACVLVPNQKLVYIAAAYQAGQEVSKTEIFDKALKLLNQKIDAELEKEKK